MTEGGLQNIEIHIFFVQWESIYQIQELDDEVLREMAVAVNKPREVLHKSLSEWAYDRGTATYLLIWQRKQKTDQFSIRGQ